MKANRPSITAQGIALVRALESRKPADERICFDPLAHLFVHPLLLWLGPVLLWYGTRLSPGVAEFLIARTRYFDDAVLASLQQGMWQLVILGAGYDTRAYRLDALRSLTHLFEVDHPATQQVKRRRLEQRGITIPENVRYVPLDFLTGSLDTLFSYGYQVDLPTLFIWEGVTYYLSAAAVNQTLAWIRRHACQGSCVLFDYAYAEALARRKRRPEIVRMQRYRRLTGEALVFGIPEGTIETFLTERGFTTITSVTSADLEQRYFQVHVPARRVAPIYAIVSACSHSESRQEVHI